jgi:hypothetical protein
MKIFKGIHVKDYLFELYYNKNNLLKLISEIVKGNKYYILDFIAKLKLILFFEKLNKNLNEKRFYILCIE